MLLKFDMSKDVFWKHGMQPVQRAQFCTNVKENDNNKSA